MRRMLHCKYSARRIGVYSNQQKEETGNALDVALSNGDDTMAYAPSALAPRALAFARTPARTGQGFFARLLAAMAASRQRQAEREIARYLAGTGGKLTDEIEREIERRYLSTPSHW
jgi:hypothetical protein